MKIIRPRSLFSILGASALLTAFCAVPVVRAQVVDPDPELFDGTKTKSGDDKDKKKESTGDKWEKANLIIYDSNEQGSQQGGQGRAGGQNPGMDMGSGGGGGISAGLPIPMGGGAGTAMGGSGLEIPELGQQGGGGGEEESEKDKAAGGGNPQGNQQGPKGSASGGGKEPPKKPGEVAIGDNSQKIAASAAPVGDTSGLEKTDDQTKGDGGDDTTMKAASGQQSGRRGGGVEKGDAIPTDL